MQINRLFEIVYILLNRKSITAKELAEQFEVSVRTIYRDVDTLSEAGIPIYTNKGKGGGISLLDSFVLNKSMLSEQEQNELLISLQSLNVFKYLNVQPVLNKLSTFFNKQSSSWIHVDFSHWGNDVNERNRFDILKNAILSSRVVAFNYYSSYEEKTTRKVEPLKLIFKGQSWYLHAFCRMKNDYRIFKVTRIRDFEVTQETFERQIPAETASQLTFDSTEPMVHLKLLFSPKLAYRIYDEFPEDKVEKNADGTFTVTLSFQESNWIYSYILSFGNDVEILEPQHVRNNVIQMLNKALEKYK